MTRPRLVVNAAWPDVTGAEIALARDAGADGVGLPDSPRLFPDPLLATERLLVDTDVALAGPCVLGTGLRHPATVGVALRTLADRHGGRVFAVLARGESAVRNEGLAPPRLAAHLAALAAVAERTAELPITLLGAASGPRTIAGTARGARGVLLDVGADPEVVAAAAATARTATPAVPCWLFLRAAVTADAPVAAAPLLGSCAHRLAAAPDWYRVPDPLRDDVAALAAAHDYATHGRGDATPAEGPAAGFVRDRFFALGPAEDVAARVRELCRAGGVDGIVLAGATGGLRGRLADTVAAVRAGTTGVTAGSR
ncbi:hypothetical protein SAMN05443575_2585 [Jatrophihabitans endophyticus]|uniref:Flavin-dependent oxidoreductase, luciferase family (Includes alkanesulfonate monooxygenase SsuD and methylene tetrahydromethanopterin reductase) n=1 Tax=Jatrophihabitans endophyticus TaxID=1206085 RepID=A0A1M5LZ13_9ACTN|nr:hypothetical protein [Jatrophihabitans endophyticus]SHG70261.1 hypothetical protein SAMN05443575_2585 [Jatrophihabitans endophyticus]